VSDEPELFGEVIEVRFRQHEGDEKGALTRKAKVYGGDACNHRTSVVDIRLREIRCDKCNQLFDALTVLDEMARHWDREINWLRSVRREAAALRAEVETLKRERANHKAAIRRHGGR
jgi:hypothetical protein